MSEVVSADGLVTTNPRRMGGVPCVTGTRVPVDHIIELLKDCTDEDIHWHYPSVTVEQVRQLRAREAGVERIRYDWARVECPTCGAQRDTHCRALSSGRSTDAHARRLQMGNLWRYRMRGGL